MTHPRLPLHEADNLRVRVTVREQLPDGTTGDPIDLTGATMACAIGTPDTTGTAGTVIPVDLTAGIVDVAFGPVGNITASWVVAQLRVTRDGETQTAWEQTYAIRPSISGA